MPGLAQSLQGHDLGHLHIVAELWGIELHAKGVQDAIQQLVAALPDMAANGWDALPEDARQALVALAQMKRIPWGHFSRQYGELREMGAGRRDRERPHLQPVSTTETLWYRGLAARAFFDTPQGPVEFAYIPEEMLAIIPAAKETMQPFGRPARPEERAHIELANDQILDQACTLLAGLRMGLSAEELVAAEAWGITPATMRALLATAKILDGNDKPIPETTRRFLEADRSQALVLLVRTWLNSEEFNELRLMPGLLVEGNWVNDAIGTRRKILAFSRRVPAGQWWSLAALIADVKARQPDYQRPAGDYDSWYLRDAASGEYLRGFAHWDQVDGALIANLIRGPMHALGLLDLAAPQAQAPAAAFRLSSWAKTLLKGNAPEGLKAESAKLKVDSRGKVLIPVLSPRATRYLVARFCEWLPKQKDAYVYQITARSLERARKQGLKVAQLLKLLKAQSIAALPPNLVQALKRWEQQGAQARLGKALVLRLGSAGALKALCASRAGRYLGEPLGPTAITVKAGAGQQVLQALLELGYLGELEEDNG
ncbi:MAG: helicase-associated domain-containing protein [Anaerolineales bacterium]